MNLKTIIVEDEKLSREILKNYLLKYCKDVTIVGEAENINEAEKLINANELDLIFLDVEMPFGNAFDLLDKIKNRTFEVVFVTAYEQYAIEALNNQASYYLLKPLSIDELINAVNHVREIKFKENVLQNKILKTRNKIVGKITIPQQNGFNIISVDDILFCKADDNYTELYLKDSLIVASKTLKHFEDMLEEYSFIRVHKSYLVNINAIVNYKKGKGGSIVLSNGKEINVAASKKAKLLSYFS